MVCVRRATATHIDFDSTRKVPCVQSRLSRRERLTDEGRGAGETKHDKA
jgi:hypothetical protein